MPTRANASTADLDGSAHLQKTARSPLATSFSIAPDFRVRLVLVLALVDLLATVFALHVAIGPDISNDLFLFAMVLVFAARLGGLYSVQSSADLHRSATGVLALCVVLLPASAGAAWLVAGESAAWHAAVATACGALIASLARVACGFAVPRFADQIIERVLVIAVARTALWPVTSGYVLSRRVRIVGQIMVRDPPPGHTLADSIATEVARATTGTNQKGDVDRIIILKAGLTDDQLLDILQGLQAVSYPVLMMPDAASLERAGRSPGDGAYILRHPPIAPGTMFLKRAMDLVVSGLIIAVLSPVLLAIALAVRLDSPGPALFRQARYGRDNRPFTVFKFRTMFVNAPAADGSMQAVRGDKRITRIGGFLRKSSLDELPQLFNVLNGSMSLVGPRPHPTELDHRFMPLIESYAVRNRIPPGITGWAQVNGLRGETRSVEDMRRRIELDLEYIHNYSLTFDIWILLRTFVAVVSLRNAY